MKRIILFFIRGYQVLFSKNFSKVVYLGNGCKFQPTCSNYMYQAVSKYGTIKGLFLGFRRIFRCNPFSKGGYDPVR